MTEVRYIHFVVPESIIVRKPSIPEGRLVVGRNTFTLDKEVKQWMKGSVRDHWILKENREPRSLWTHSPSGGGQMVEVMMPMALLIAFRNPKEAMLFKLAWL